MGKHLKLIELQIILLVLAIKYVESTRAGRMIHWSEELCEHHFSVLFG